MIKKNHKKFAGFTLIEIIVAMLVLSFTMVATIQSFNTIATNTANLQRHHIAYWVGSNYLIQQRIDNQVANPKIIRTKVKMANKEWIVESQDTPSFVPQVSKILVQVFDDKSDKTPVVMINGYKANLK